MRHRNQRIDKSREQSAHSHINPAESAWRPDKLLISDHSASRNLPNNVPAALPHRNEAEHKQHFGSHRHSAFHGETDFDRHLPVIYFALIDLTSRFNHLKPAQLLDGFVRTLDGCIDRLFNGVGRCAGEFNEFIDFVFHIRYLRVIIRNAALLTVAGVRFLDRLLDSFAGFTRALLNPAQQFLLLAFFKLEIAIGELGPLLLQFAFRDVPVALDF